jgi:hypothetical protein
MSDHVLQLVERYRSRGVLVDSNVLLLYFVGAYERRLVPRFKRTAQFTVQDYDLLVYFLSNFRRIVPTPNILTEVNALLGQLGEPPKIQCRARFGPEIARLGEDYVPSADAVGLDQFPRLGLTDAVIARLAKGNHLVLTDDAKLAVFLERTQIDVVNFNHLRPLWSL